MKAEQQHVLQEQKTLDAVLPKIRVDESHGGYFLIGAVSRSQTNSPINDIEQITVNQLQRNVQNVVVECNVINAFYMENKLLLLLLSFTGTELLYYMFGELRDRRAEN